MKSICLRCKLELWLSVIPDLRPKQTLFIQLIFLMTCMNVINKFKDKFSKSGWKFYQLHWMGKQLSRWIFPTVCASCSECNRVHQVIIKVNYLMHLHNLKWKLISFLSYFFIFFTAPLPLTEWIELNFVLPDWIGLDGIEFCRLFFRYLSHCTAIVNAAILKLRFFSNLSFSLLNISITSSQLSWSSPLNYLFVL